MVKIGDKLDEGKSHKPRNKWKDFGEFLNDYWWGLIVAALVIGWLVGDIGDAFKPNTPIVKEKAVVVNVEDSYEDYKVKYLSDGAVAIIDLGDDGYVVGDTVLAER